MEDGWVLAQALAYFSNDLSKALPLFNEIRLPYYARMYEFLASEAERRKKKLEGIGEPSFDEKVRSKVISDGGKGLDWIYGHDVEDTWRSAVGEGASKV